MVVDEFEINKSDLFRSSINSPSDLISTFFEDRASNLPERETSIFGSIMRTVRHSTGTGPGTGGGPGAGGGPGDRK